MRSFLAGFFAVLATCSSPSPSPAGPPKIRVSGGSFVADGRPFVPFGVNYFRPGTGWAPQVWKRFDPEAVRADFARLKSIGANCVRVFLTFGSFYPEPGALDSEGLRKFDRFLDLAEEAGLYVHPTGPDHWEGLPAWANERFADERALAALEQFWRLFAGRYRGRSAIFAYDLLNEPHIGWSGEAMKGRWRRAIPEPRDRPGDPTLLEYQNFREELADEWTARQARAIKSADPDALVTVGLVQWSVPVVLPGGPSHYSAFRPSRQAGFVDFLSVHFYPLADGAYRYESAEARLRNLAYLEAVVAEVARAGKPVVVGEFGWYGGGAPPRIDRAATEEEQAAWCADVVRATDGIASGWLNWGVYDHPEADDISILSGLFTVDGREKAWARRFAELAVRERSPRRPVDLPALDWDALRTGGEARREALDRALRRR